MGISIFISVFVLFVALMYKLSISKLNNRFPGHRNPPPPPPKKLGEEMKK